MRPEPGQVHFHITPAMKRALHAVNNGDIVRVVTKDGNVFRARIGSVSYRLLWVLVRHRLIEDGEHTGRNEVTMRLSSAGLQLLR